MAFANAQITLLDITDFTISLSTEYIPILVDGAGQLINGESYNKTVKVLAQLGGNRNVRPDKVYIDEEEQDISNWINSDAYSFNLDLSTRTQSGSLTGGSIDFTCEYDGMMATKTVQWSLVVQENNTSADKFILQQTVSYCIDSTDPNKLPNGYPTPTSWSSTDVQGDLGQYHWTRLTIAYNGDNGTETKYKYYRIVENEFTIPTTLVLYKRATSIPTGTDAYPNSAMTQETLPNGKTIVNPASMGGWSVDIPSGTAPRYIIKQTVARSSSSSIAIFPKENWSAPELDAQSSFTFQRYSDVYPLTSNNDLHEESIKSDNTSYRYMGIAIATENKLPDYDSPLWKWQTNKGADGAPAVTYDLQSSADFVIMNTLGQPTTPSLTFTGQKITGNSAPINLDGTFKIVLFKNGVRVDKYGKVDSTAIYQAPSVTIDFTDATTQVNFKEVQVIKAELRGLDGDKLLKTIEVAGVVDPSATIKFVSKTENIEAQLQIDATTGISSVVKSVSDLGESVSTIKSTSETLELSVKNLKIGGTNLLQLENDINAYVHAEKRVDQSLVGKSYYKSGTTLVLYRPQNDASIISFRYPTIDGTIENPGRYMLSFYVWSVGENNLTFYTDLFEQYQGDHYYYFKEHKATTDVVKYELPIEHTTGQHSVEVRFHTSQMWSNPDAYICITDVKFEEGTKATTWSANTDDLRHETSAKIEVLSNAIESKVSSEEFNEYGKARAKFETDISQTATDIDLKVDNIKIGGTNILRLENPNNGFLYAEKRVDPSLVGKTFYKSGTTLVLKRPPSGSSVINFFDTPLMGTPDKPGEYMLSFYAWSVGENNLAFYTDVYEYYEGDHYYYITDHTATTDVVRFELPIEYTAGQRNLQVRFHTNHVWGNPDAYICITDVQLEEGTRATDWSSNNEEFRAGSNLKITSEGIKMSGGEIEMNAGTAFRVNSGGSVQIASGGTIQIDTASGQDSHINLGDGNFSASKDGGVVADSGHFGAQLDVAGRRVLTLGDVSHKIVISSSDPGGTDLIWIKPFAMSSTSYTGYTASSRNETVDFARTNPIVRTFSSVDRVVLSGGEITYSQTVPLYSVGSSLDWFTLSGSLSKNGQTVQLSAVDCQIRPWKTTTVTLAARSSINLCSDVGGITVTLYGDRHGLGGNVYLQKETNMTLVCTVESANGMMDCAVKYIPIGLKHSELIAEPGTVLGDFGGRVFTTNVWGFCCVVNAFNGAYRGPVIASPIASDSPITTSDGFTLTYAGQRGDGWYYTSMSAFMPTSTTYTSAYPLISAVTGTIYSDDVAAIADDLIRYYNREI